MASRRGLGLGESYPRQAIRQMVANAATQLCWSMPCVRITDKYTKLFLEGAATE